MNGDTGLWARVMERYGDETELRAGPLSGRFRVIFRGGLLVITKSNGVTKSIDFDEFRATWRMLASGASSDAVGRVTGNGIYLQAVREDLIASGVDGGLEASMEAPDDVSSVEGILLSHAADGQVVEEAPVQIPEPDHADPCETSLAELRSELQREQETRADSQRELARLTAQVEVLDEHLRQERERADRLEQLATRAEPRQFSGIGAQTDVVPDLLRVAEALVASTHADEDLRRSLQLAIEFATRDPAAATAKARTVTEQLVRREWALVMGADASSTRKSFQDYARELEGNRRVNPTALAIKRTLYRVCNPAAHELTVSPRRAALVLVVLASVLDTGTSGS